MATWCDFDRLLPPPPKKNRSVASLTRRLVESCSNAPSGPRIPRITTDGNGQTRVKSNHIYRADRRKLRASRFGRNGRNRRSRINAINRYFTCRTRAVHAVRVEFRCSTRVGHARGRSEEFFRHGQRPETNAFPAVGKMKYFTISAARLVLLTFVVCRSNVPA